MWRNVQFFVSADVLMTFEHVKLSDLSGRAGLPQHRIAVVDGKAVPVTSYPAASLFLKALKGTGSRVIVISPWSVDKTTALLRLFGWDAFDEVRSVYQLPGSDTFHLASLHCSVEDYSNSLVLTTSRAAWHASLRAQIVEVRHEIKRPAYSLALLRALSRCLRITEGRVRFPHTAVGTCATLCSARLFAYCRFCLAPSMAEHSSVAMMITEYGGYLVSKPEDATHFVVGEDGVAPKILKKSKTSSLTDIHGKLNEQNNNKNNKNNNLTSYTDDDDDEEEENIEEEEMEELVNEDDMNKNNEDYAEEYDANEDMEEKLEDMYDEAAKKNTLNYDSFPTQLDVLPSASSAVTVTTRWLRDCAEGLNIYPPRVAHSGVDGTLWDAAMLLLAALLPPSDAEPLSLEQFDAIAESQGFCQISNAGFDDIADALRQQWGAELCVESINEDVRFSRPLNPPNEGGTEMEHHLAFIAAQFSEVWEVASREWRRSRAWDAGTQTAVVLTAATAVNTDAVATPAAERTPAEVPGRTLLMRALGPAEWAREVDAAAHTALQPRPADVPVKPTVAMVTEPPSGRDSPPLPEVDIGAEMATPLSPLNGSGGVSNNKSSDSTMTAALDGGGAVVAGAVGGDYLRCFISTDALGDAAETLEKDVLLRQLPFRNYPMKVSIDKRGIHCLFVTSLDATRFCREGHAEVRGRALPIVPEYEYEDEEKPLLGSRKRRRSRSPTKKSSSATSGTGISASASAPSRSSRREPPPSYGAHAKAVRSPAELLRATDDDDGGNGGVGGDGGYELTKAELDLLGEIGATYDFALNNVDVVEHYALNDLLDPAFRKQQQQLLRVVAKLKRTKS